MPERCLPRENKWPVANSVFVAALICFYALCLFVPARWAALYMSYGRTLIIVTAALYFWHMRLHGCVELKLVIFYAFWMLITRVLNGDTYLQQEYDLVLSRFLCCVVMAAPLVLKGKERERFYDTVIAIYCGIFFVAALIGIYCCLLGCYIVLPPEDCVFGVERQIEYLFTNFVAMFGTIRNISCAWIFPAWCMMAYEFAKTDSRLWRIPITAAWLVFTLCLIMSYSRTMVIIFCLCCAMTVMLVLQKKLKIKSAALKALIIVLAAALVFAACYKGVEVSRDAICLLSGKITQSVPRVSGSFIHYHDTVNTDFSDPRTGGTSAANLSGRTEIYMAAIKLFLSDPKTMLIGKYSFKIQPALASCLPPDEILPVMHSHNYLLQTALLTGFIGLALVAFFSVLMLIRMLRLFFTQDSRVSSADKLLTLPVAGLFIYSMMEIMIFTNCCDDRYFGCDLRELIFFLSVGMLLARYYDIFTKETQN